METIWNGTVALLEGQTALAHAEWALHGEESVHIRMTSVSPDLVINCTRVDGQFICEHEDVPQMVSVGEWMHVVPGENRFSMEVRLKALADGTADVTFEIIDGPAHLHNVSLIAD